MRIYILMGTYMENKNIWEEKEPRCDIIEIYKDRDKAFHGLNEITKEIDLGGYARVEIEEFDL